MMALRNKKISPRVSSALLGVLFGLLFPLYSSFIELRSLGYPLSLNSILQVQRSNPLLWVIDTAPLFLGIFAWFAGIRKEKLEDQTNHLDDLVESRSLEVVRQKLFYEALVENNPIAVVTLDKAHNVLSINPAFKELFGFRLEEVKGKNIDSLIANPSNSEESKAMTHQVLTGKGIHDFGCRRRKDGRLVEVEIFGEPITVDGSLIGALGLYRDITSEKQVKDLLAASEERFRKMFIDSPIALRMQDFSKVKKWIDDKDEEIRANFKDHLISHPEDVVKLFSLIDIIEYNTAALQLFSAGSKEELLGKIYSILSKESRLAAVDIFCALLDGKTSLERELVYTRLDGKLVYTITKISVMPGFEDSWGRILFSNIDITDRKTAEERLTFISLHDIMTSLYNRAFFDEELARYEKSRVRPISVLVMDMDNFKAINDRIGHLGGDKALQIIANIIQSSFREEDITARIGGDEFAVLLPTVDKGMAQKAKERILKGIERYNNENSDSVPLSLSIGFATADKNGSLEEAFKQADEAMYLEKKKKIKIV